MSFAQVEETSSVIKCCGRTHRSRKLKINVRISLKVQKNLSFDNFQIYVWPTLFLLNVFTALKGTHLCIFIKELTIPHCMRMQKMQFAGLFHENDCSVPEVIKHFSCSTQMSMKFKLLINTEIAKRNGNFRFKSQKPFILLINVKMPTIVSRFHSQLS